MYGELTRHAKLIAGLQKQARKLQDATDGMLVLIETAYTTELPKDYAIVEQTPLGAKSAATDGPVQISEAEREQKRAQVSQLRANLAERLEAEVHTPANNYIADVRATKVELKNLEKVRLSLDTQRRKTAKAEVKKVKQTLNKGANSNSFVERHTVATQQLEEFKQQFDAQEETVYQKLRELVARSNVVFDCMEKAFAAGNDVMNKAQSMAPANSAMGMAPPGTYTVVENEKTPFTSPEKEPVAPAVAETEGVKKVKSKKGSAPKVVDQAIAA